MNGTYAYYNPLRELHYFQKQLSDLFETFNERRGEYPLVNIWGNPEGLLVTAELPGLDVKDIHLTAKGDTLSLEVDKKTAVFDSQDICIHRNERGTEGFIKTVRLPYEVNGENISARYANGILKVTLLRAEASKPRKITVTQE